MVFRDYMYLDTGRLQDYVSGLDQGVIEEFTETTRSQLDKEGGAKLRAHILEAGGGGRSEEETTREQTVRITAQHMFSRVYDEMDNAGSIRIFDEDDPLALDLLRRREVVEITRSFEPSPLNDMIDSILRLMHVMKKMGFTEEVGDPETQQIVRALAMIFRGAEGNEEVPMVSRADQSDASVVFLAKSKHILVDQDDFRGEMTVFGKVRKLVPAGRSIDLFDFVKLPSAMRGEATLKEELLGMFESWPKELGGPIAKDSLEVKGPAIIVTPGAVYEA